MEICSEEHSPIYKITYRGAKNVSYNPQWLVCEKCHQKKIFGTQEDIVDLERLA